MHRPFENLGKIMKGQTSSVQEKQITSKSELKFDFSVENIQKIFGHEAAEDEQINNLKDYYFRTDIYEQIAADLKLRILVGHKGVGKSALFKILVNKDNETNIIPVEIKPDDVAELGTEEKDFLQMIREWKKGIQDIIVTKTLQNIFSDINTNDDFPTKPATIKNIISSIISIGASYISKIGNGINKEVYENFKSKNKLNIYIDDLDRGWKGTKADISRLSSMLNAIRDLSNENENVHFKVSLRSDVYYLVRTSDESTDKIGGSVVWFTWTNHQILALLVKRILAYQGKSISEDQLMAMSQDELAFYLRPIMTERFEGRGKWENVAIHRVLMSLIRKRPRDLVKLCTLAAKNTRKRHGNMIETIDFQEIFESYSTDRVQDTINEFRSELPNIKILLFSLRPSVKAKRKYSEAYVYDREQLIEKLKQISKEERFCFTSSADEIATPEKLLAFLYKIGFITARRESKDGKIIRKTFEENKYLSEAKIDFHFKWEVHPAYRWALEPDDFEAIYTKLDVISDWE